MQPQSGKKNKPQHTSTESEPARVPITVRGQRYVAPAGRHSQQTHKIAEQRAAESGHASEKEQHAQDRTTLTDGIAAVAAQKKQNQEQSRQK